jgi:hypothetical protein
MKKLLWALIFLPVAALADVHTAKYGVESTFNFVLYNADGTLDDDEADGGTEVSVACDEGAETTATNDFADEGTFYSITLTAAEMQCARVAVVVAATDTNIFFVETYGHASSQNPDIDPATAQADLDLLTDPVGEPAGVPAWSTATAADLIAWLAAWTRNEVNQTATTKSLRNDADTANLAECTVSDDATTFTRAECAAP